MFTSVLMHILYSHLLLILYSHIHVDARDKSIRKNAVIEAVVQSRQVVEELLDEDSSGSKNIFSVREPMTAEKRSIHCF